MEMSSFFVYPILFLGVYAQVFLFITFLEKRKDILIRKGSIDLPLYPGVTIVVPCYNEEKTISKTVESLLNLDYPKDNLKLILIDDGSKDNTFFVLQKFESENIKVIKKENGGKHTAQNLGLKHAGTPYVGCLDSDSLVHSQALKRIMNTFLKNKDVSAVVPSILVSSPKNIVERAQKAEYDLAVYNKKMLAFLGAIHVTPGPFSIFKRSIFDDIGPYKKAHNTEDQEIALRMHKHGYRIENCPDAYVYTAVPKTISKLYHQRVRWTYGFLRNMIDYRELIFKKKFGNLGFFTLPSGIISLIGVMAMFSILLSNIFTFVSKKILQIKTIGLSLSVNNIDSFKFDSFFINTKALLFIIILTYIMLVISISVGKKIAEGKSGIPFNVLYLIPLYSLVAPFWIIRSFWNAIFKKESNWQAERASIKI